MKDKISASEDASVINANLSNDIENLSEDKFLDYSVVKVVFKDEQFFKKHKSRIERFLKDLLDEDKEFNIKNVESEKCNQSFHIDNVDDANNDSTANKCVPYYTTSYEDVLHFPEPVVEENIKESNKPQTMTCFNCLGDHHMKDCQEQIDRQRIAANRKDLVALNTSRYHVEEKRNAIKPGCLSSQLRNALGLEKDQLPSYIYSMRVIGYPPGWKEEAIHETSGLSLYDNSEDISENDSANVLSRKTQYEAEKLVNYPGFNTPVPEGFKDEWLTLGWIPIQRHQQLSEILKADNTINRKNMYKRKDFKSTNNEDTKKRKSGMNDLESHWSPENTSTPKQTKPNSRLDKMEFESPVSQNSLSNSLSKSPGTPIVSHGNPFLKLPDADKFAQDITEHLPFENLPDSVGKYENMRNVLNTVQKKLRDISKS